LAGSLTLHRYTDMTTFQTVDSVEVVYVDEHAAAKMTGFSVFTFQQWRSRGNGGPPFYKPNGKKVLYKVHELLAWIESARRVPAATQLQQQAGR
jgi:hypothetical protein